MPASQKSPNYDDLERLFVNNPDLDEIRAYLSKFNPIKTMGMERMEIRHSAILAWLLDPQQTHGLGDKFLKAFVSEALRGNHPPMQPSALQVSQADMMEAEVRREWRNIDILLISPRNKWIFVIENKFDSGQHNDQLTRYLKTVKKTFREEDFPHIRGIFLSLWGDEPEDDRYSTIKYNSIYEILEQQALSGRHPLNAEVKTFITHYMEVIRDTAGMKKEKKQNELEKLAKQLYRDHRLVLDFIIEHGKATDFSSACDLIFGEGLENRETAEVDKRHFILHRLEPNRLSFLPQSWYQAFGKDEFRWPGCENWWMEFPVIMWVQLMPASDGTSGKIKLVAEVGPLSDHDFRRELIESIQNIPKKDSEIRIGFQSGATEMGRRYSRMFKMNPIDVDDVQDQEIISNKIREALKEFRPEIDAVAALLPQFKRHGIDKANEE